MPDSRIVRLMLVAMLIGNLLVAAAVTRERETLHLQGEVIERTLSALESETAVRQKQYELLQARCWLKE